MTHTERHSERNVIIIKQTHLNAFSLCTGVCALAYARIATVQIIAWYVFRLLDLDKFRSSVLIYADCIQDNNVK